MKPKSINQASIENGERVKKSCHTISGGKMLDGKSREVVITRKSHEQYF
ncbi:unnamed protein product [Arabidopsis halleri]